MRSHKHTHAHTNPQKTAHSCRKALFTHALTQRVDRRLVTELHCAGLIHLVFHMSNCITTTRNTSLSLPRKHSQSRLLLPTTAACGIIHPFNQYGSNGKPADIRLTPRHTPTAVLDTRCQTKSPASHGTTQRDGGPRQVRSRVPSHH